MRLNSLSLRFFLLAVAIVVWLRERRWRMEPVAVSAIAGVLVVAGMLVVSPQTVGTYLRRVAVNAAIQTQTAMPTSSMLSAQALTDVVFANVKNLPGRISLMPG